MVRNIEPILKKFEISTFGKKIYREIFRITKG